MYVCPTPDLADLADPFFAEREQRNEEREREEENAKENERKE
jgi:hypothetical protein